MPGNGIGVQLHHDAERLLPAMHFFTNTTAIQNVGFLTFLTYRALPTLGVNVITTA
jgi:hypothetical protein